MCDFVSQFTHDGVEEISHAEGAGDERKDLLALDIDLSGLSNVGEGVNTKLLECEFGIVGVGREICASQSSDRIRWREMVNTF